MSDHRWVFGESSTSNPARDWIGNVNGTYNNCTLGGPGQGRYGIGGYVQLLGEASSYVDFGTGVGQFGTSTFTVTLWFNARQAQPSFDIVGNRTAPSHGNFFSLRMSAKGQIVAEVDQDQNGTNYAIAESQQSGLTDNNWHHVAVVRASQSLALYVDGQPSATGIGKGTAKIANGNPFRLGRSLANGTSPMAVYTDLGVYSAELDPRTIYHIYCFH